jgi:hypothetical protein
MGQEKIGLSSCIVKQQEWLHHGEAKLCENEQSINTQHRILLAWGLSEN